jgi:acid phosphatase type 7
MLDDLAPDETCHYRVVAKEIVKIKGYDVTYGEEVATPLATFTAPNPRRDTVAFSMINDTHEKYPVVEKLLGDPAKPSGDWIVHCGDAIEPASELQLQNNLLNPLARLFAARTPMLFVRGNHDTRGVFAPHLRDYLYLPEGKFYYQFRQGPAHFTVLDGGEDKGDEHQYLRGLTDFTAYLRKQFQWLRSTVLPSESFRTAAFRVVLCHMPIHRGRMDFPLPWMKEWSAALDEGGVDLMLSGHIHRHSYEAPNADHRYHLLIGGGPEEANATRTDVRITANEISLRQHAADGRQLGEWTIGKQSA